MYASVLEPDDSLFFALPDVTVDDALSPFQSAVDKAVEISKSELQIGPAASLPAK